MAWIWAAWGFLATLALAAPAAALSPEDARHLLSRTGYGASPAEIAELAPFSRTQAVDLILSRTRTEPVVPSPEFLARAWPPYRDFPGMTQERRDHFIQARRVELQLLKAWWYAEMIATPSPLTERMTLFWHNHFVSAFEAVGHNVHRLWDQNRLFRREATGSFAVLVYEILRDPVMLRYLDNNSNRRGRPNENLARELLELFTLGEGHYTEADIKEIARALTGRTAERTTDFGFRFVAGMHDDGIKAFLGRRGQFGGDDVARIVLEQPRTAEFVAEKLWREFVSPAAPSRADIERVAAALQDSRYQVKPALRALLLSEEFWAPAARGALVKSPTALIVGMHRDLGLPVVDPQALPVYGRRLGQDLFEPPNVKGWPGDALWITPALLVNRHDVLTRLLANRDLVPAQRGRAVSLRVAGDAWRGLPRMVVSVNDGAIRETKDIDFAVDTERFGNLSDRADWVWRVVRVPVDGAVEKVAVEFVNDGGAPVVDGVRRGDRNLFVDWIEIDGETFPALAARQIFPGGNCPTAKPGDLYCNGRLDFDLAAMRASGVARTGELAMETTMGGGMMQASIARPGSVPRSASGRAVHLDAGSWRATLPAAWRDPREIWRALAPLPPVASVPQADLEAALRTIVLDPVYQVQ